MDRIEFCLNGEKCSVGSEVDSDVMLVDYIREYKELRGTKYMCREAGCGACIVAVTAPDPCTRHPITFSVNSCMISITQCQDWNITTVEGIGNRLKGYHPIQKTLAEYDGTQCGFCSDGWVMSMYSLLESKGYDLTEYEIEDSLGSNQCRCTGYRPILDAFKSFAKDAPKPNKHILDIEDLSICEKKGDCKSSCKSKNSWCWVSKLETEEKTIKKIKLRDNRIWYRVNEIGDIFKIFSEEGTDSYMLVGGNTGKGPYHIFEYPRVLIDINGIFELKRFYLDQNLVIGGGTTLTDLLNILKNVSKTNEEFGYLEKFYEHIMLVAHIPVRNVGTIAGNYMVKHRVPEFSSDIFLLTETVGATISITGGDEGIVEVSPEEFTKMDMTGKLILNVKLPPLLHNYHFVSFKVMPRSQNAHAQVNAAFLYEFDTNDKETILSARIVIGGLSPKFVHAKNLEKYLVGKKLFTNEVLQEGLKVLDKELIVEEIAGEMKPEFRRKVALGLFYKGLLALIPRNQLKPRYRSGAFDLKKTRPVSKGKDVFDTNPIIWPITEPYPKIEALSQCSGETKYTNDLPKQPQEVHAAFVTSDIGRGEIVDIDPSPALKMAGVLAFFTAKDIPGKNSFMSLRIGPPAIFSEEEVLSNGTIKYYDQAIGIIVAETAELANRAALLVQVKYKTENKAPLLTINEVRSQDPSRVTVFFILPPRGRGVDVKKVIKDTHNILSQYHYTMETISCVARPSEDGLDVFPSTHYADLSHCAVSDVLNIQQNRINMQVPPNGGSYGSRLTRSTQVVAACALASYLMNRPCRFVMSMQANMRIIGKRLPCTNEFEVGVSDSGEIQYLEYHFYEDNGYVFGDPIIYLALGSIRNAYDNTRWSYKMFNVTTNTASNSWCRAPGTLEAIAMTEYIMEQISYEINKDPLEVRLNNLDRRDPTLQEIVDKLIKDSEYYKRKEEVKKFNEDNRWKKRGLRVALMNWSSLVLMDHQVMLSVHHGDGTVVVKHGGVEVGQGVNTKVTQVVAYTLNIPMSKVKVKRTDVASNPNSFLTGGSRTTESVSFGAIKCCQILLDRLAILRDTLRNPEWEVLIQAAFRQGINLQTSYHTTSSDGAAYRCAGAAVAEVELDILTGEHHILRVDIIEDVGTSANPVSDVGQIEGGFIMGVGYWTTEHLIYDPKTGELLTDRTWFYDIPQAKDIPIDFRIQLRRNSFNPLDVLGAKSSPAGECCNDSSDESWSAQTPPVGERVTSSPSSDEAAPGGEVVSGPALPTDTSTRPVRTTRSVLPKRYEAYDTTYVAQDILEPQSYEEAVSCPQSVEWEAAMQTVSEPPTCLAVVVGFAIREAIAASREESGIPRTEWFNVDGPYTIEANVLKAEAKLEEFLFH